MASLDALLSEIETQWEQLATRAIADKITEHPSEQFYAAGFWLFYCDYTVIHPPCLGMNTESHLAQSPDDAEYSRWSPPNFWQFDVLDGTTDVIMSEYEPLHGDHDDPTWEQIMEDHKQAIARVCRRVTAIARKGSGPFHGLSIHPAFVVGYTKNGTVMKNSIAWPNSVSNLNYLPTWMYQLDKMPDNKAMYQSGLGFRLFHVVRLV